MIYTKDIDELIDTWQLSLQSFKDSPDYVDGIRDCIYDLSNLVTKSIDEELTYQDFLEMEADSYLASIEAHEKVA